MTRWVYIGWFSAAVAKHGMACLRSAWKAKTFLAREGTRRSSRMKLEGGVARGLDWDRL